MKVPGEREPEPPTVTCSKCGHRVRCHVDRAGKAWRPSWWTYADAETLVGLCHACSPPDPEPWPQSQDDWGYGA